MWVCVRVGVCICGCVYVWVCVCVGFVMCGCVYVWVYVCVGFVMCGCVYVWVYVCVGFVMFGYCGNMYTCFYCVFELFGLCIFIFICVSVRTTAIE